ncbi:hypothetical protein IC229_27690 [Spirosoma sp. BT702]|uniref:Uncharacterized protein n=1 Tax=Spirosoma profusum TaxID=2771354 RepID=A0A926Y0Q5_9BACT|nr:hypothetical protein [Spirosoma profusum]MBD2704454.1 hypothetical protein [Spirosoma profusum]
MTYISAQPRLTSSWDDICYPVQPVWLADLLPEYDIMATDRQQLVVGQLEGGRKTIFGIHSADYAIIPNSAIREVVDALMTGYQLQIKYTTTGEFSISIILPNTVAIGGELLHRSLILTNSYNGKTPFSLQGVSLPTLLDTSTAVGGSVYRDVCQNGLMGWADKFNDLSNYQAWLQAGVHQDTSRSARRLPTKAPSKGSNPLLRTIHHRGLTIEVFQQHLRDLLADHLKAEHNLTATVYDHLQQINVSSATVQLLRKLPVPVQLAKQAQERLRLEERLLNSPPSYWLLYNAVNYALFTGRSSLTLNDRYRLDERVFHQLAAQAYG